MKRITLDYNCLCDLEENRSSAHEVRRIVAAHGNGQIEVFVLAIAASENPSERKRKRSQSEFFDKLKTLGLDHLEHFLPLGYWGLTYWCLCVWGSKDNGLDEEIQNVLFPSIDTSYEAYVRRVGGNADDKHLWKKWSNAKCDVLGMWSHIRNKADIFVTRDGNFHKQTKKPRLIDLGAGAIMTPSQVIEHCGL